MPVDNTRRKFLKGAGTTGAIALFAGCTGGSGGDGGGGSTGTPGSSAADLAELEGEEWRTEAMNQAEQELSNQDLIFVSREERLTEVVGNVDYSQYHDTYGVFNNSVSFSTGNAQTIVEAYAKEIGNVNQASMDVIDAKNVLMHSQGTRFNDIMMNVPNRTNIPEEFWVGNIVPWNGRGYSLAFNTERTDPIPDEWTYDTLLDDQFADGEVAIDYTPSIAPCASILDRAGADYLAELNDAGHLTLYNSLTTTSNAVARGDQKAAIYDSTTNFTPNIEEGLPVDYVETADFNQWIGSGLAIARKCPHPAAAQLFADMMYNNDFLNNEVLPVATGIINLNDQTVYPDYLSDIWHDELFSVAQLGDTTPADLYEEWQRAIDAPTLD